MAIVQRLVGLGISAGATHQRVMLLSLVSFITLYSAEVDFYPDVGIQRALVAMSSVDPRIRLMAAVELAQASRISRAGDKAGVYSSIQIERDEMVKAQLVLALGVDNLSTDPRAIALLYSLATNKAELAPVRINAVSVLFKIGCPSTELYGHLRELAKVNPMGIQAIHVINSTIEMSLKNLGEDRMAVDSEREILILLRTISAMGIDGLAYEGGGCKFPRH